MSERPSALLEDCRWMRRVGSTEPRLGASVRPTAHPPGTPGAYELRRPSIWRRVTAICSSSAAGQADWLHGIPPVPGLHAGRISAQWRWTSRTGPPERGPSYRTPRNYSR